MIRHFLLVGAAALTLTACGKDLIGPPEAGPIYSLRPSFPVTPPAAQKTGWSLSIMRPNVPGGLDSDRIALLQPGGVLDFYANATYPDQVPALIQQALLDGFESSGRIDAVSREQDALQSDYMLVVEVKNFEAHYAVVDGIPQVQVTMTAKMTTARGRKILGSLTVSKSATATVNNTQAVTQAMTQALGAAVQDVVNWTLDYPPPPSQVNQKDGFPQGSPARPARQLLRDVTRGSADLPPQ